MIQNKDPKDKAKLLKNMINIGKDGHKLLEINKTSKIMEPSYIKI